jgi:hypothetical protein
VNRERECLQPSIFEQNRTESPKVIYFGKREAKSSRILSLTLAKTLIALAPWTAQQQIGHADKNKSNLLLKKSDILLNTIT